MRSRCALLRVKWNSDDSATNFQCSAKLIRSKKKCTIVCVLPVCYAATQSWPHKCLDKDIPGYRSLGKIRVASSSRRCTAVPVAPPGGEKLLTTAFYAFRLLCPAFSFADVDTYDTNKKKYEK